MQSESYVNIDELADFLSVSTKCIRDMVKSESIPYLKVRGVYRFKKSDVEEALRNPVDPVVELPENLEHIDIDPNEDF